MSMQEDNLTGAGEYKSWITAVLTHSVRELIHMQGPTRATSVIGSHLGCAVS